MKEGAMDARRITIAQECLKAAYDKAMSFPEIVEQLTSAGFDGYFVDYRRNTTTYFLPDGDSVALDNHSANSNVGAQFDQAGIVTQIKWAQANPPDYSYATFCKNVKALGCAG